jgi:DNA-cytosine methyltransferase
MIVLSLFDGISCGQVALKKAGIKVDAYYASEIEKSSIKVTQNNFPDTIQLGDINHWKSWNILKPDIILAGSPCQGFSFAGKQLNFNDERSILFFTFIDILDYYNPTYFLLENVVMKKEYEDIITKYCGVNPTKINSRLVSAQNRNRLYWYNWENNTFLKDKEILLKDIIDYTNTEVISDIKIKKHEEIDRYGNHSGTINTYKHPCLLKMGKSDVMLFLDLKRYLSPVEAERLQTLPDNYTKVISDSKRYEALGNGWTVDVIVYLLNNMKSENRKIRKKHFDLIDLL